MSDEAEQLKELLIAHRRTTGLALIQRALSGKSHVTPSIEATIDNGRTGIQKVKEALRSMGHDIEDLPIIDDANDISADKSDALAQLQNQIRVLEYPFPKKYLRTDIKLIVVLSLVIGLITGVVWPLIWNRFSQSTPQLTSSMASETANPSDKTISIQSMRPFHVDSYSGDGDPNTTSEQDNVQETLRVIYNSDGTTSYKLIYSLPDTEFGYVGFQFAFESARSIREFQYIEVDVEFDNESTGCGLKINDNEDKSNTTRILGPNRTFKIPIAKAAEDLNIDAVKSIEFVALTDFSRGEHYFVIHNVRLTKD